MTWREGISSVYGRYIKERPGGTEGMEYKPKIVLHYANKDNPDRCFIKLFKQYRTLYHPRCTTSCILPPTISEPHQLLLIHQQAPWTHNTRTDFARLCKGASFEGFRTNHSLRATATSRLYKAGVEEQLVIKVTGHRSVEGFRSYKRSSSTQLHALSDIVNCTPTHHTDTITSITSSSQLLQGLNLPSATFSNCTVHFYVGPQRISTQFITKG